MEKSTLALRMSILAIATAVVAVFTFAIIVPTPTTGGYVSLCDVAVTFVAYAFGPITGFIAGGLGTALSDIIGGYGQWAPISFVVHGLEGLIISLIVKKNPASLVNKIISAIVAVIIVAGGYCLLTGLFLGGFSVSIPEVPANILQAGVGVVIGLPLSMGVRKAYRKLDDIAW